MRNKFAAKCYFCGFIVYPNEGTRRKPGYLKHRGWTVFHDECITERNEKIEAKRRADKLERDKIRVSTCTKEALRLKGESQVAMYLHGAKLQRGD